MVAARALLLVLVLLRLGLVGAAQEESGVQPQDLKRLSIEELARINVTSVSRQAESLSQTPAAISVVRGEDIQRSGAVMLADAMRLGDAIDVARVNGNTSSSTRARGGLGLGLSIVRQLVEVHGGTVSAASEGRDRGSTFTVRLPVRSPKAAIEPGTPGGHAVAQGLLRGFKVVVVDDDPDTRELLHSALSAAGADVHSAGSADEAIAVCRSVRADAIVSDIGMPVRDGYSLMRELQAEGSSVAPPVAIALSAYAAPRDRERSLEAGFAEHIAKPADPLLLVQILYDRLRAALR